MIGKCFRHFAVSCGLMVRIFGLPFPRLGKVFAGLCLPLGKSIRIRNFVTVLPREAQLNYPIKDLLRNLIVYGLKFC